MPSRHERRVLQAFRARRTLTERRKSQDREERLSAIELANRQARRELIPEIEATIARTLAKFDEMAWQQCEEIIVPRKLIGYREVPGLRLGHIIVPTEHKFGTLLVSRALWLTVSGTLFYEEDGRMHAIDLSVQSKSALEEILSSFERQLRR